MTHSARLPRRELRTRLDSVLDLLEQTQATDDPELRALLEREARELRARLEARRFLKRRQARPADVATRRLRAAYAGRPPRRRLRLPPLARRRGSGRPRARTTRRTATTRGDPDPPGEPEPHPAARAAT